MKMQLGKKIIMFMAFVLIVPLLWNLNTAVAKAATPSFTETKVTIVGTGDTLQLGINNQVAKSTYKWTSSNKKVATVSKNGLVTSTGKGTATIKCVITYPSKKMKTLYSKITVTIPAEDISITNAVLVNGAYVMTLGASMDFDVQLDPVTSSDKIYWYTSQTLGDSSCIRVDDAAQGKITAVKAGKAVLVAKAASASTQAAADLSIVDASIIIEVVGPTATVNTSDITAPNEIKVVFDSAVNASTVIGLNNKLSDNVTISLRKDVKNVVADDPGSLTATLSTDLKTLTITSVNPFNGNYGIHISSDVLTSSGLALEDYYKNLSYVDTTPPFIAGTTIDDTGYIVTINFSEALDFTSLVIKNATLITTKGEIASSTTLNTLNNVLNYVISADKKSMTINMSTISPTDYGKIFSVIISGVTDKSGILPAGVYLTAYLQTDSAATKPQAKILSLIRTNYNVITVTFDRSIKTGGNLHVENGRDIPGVVDTTNNKKVTYSITDGEAATYIGAKKVSVGFWNSYNVATTDLSANKFWDYYIDFTVEKTSPVLISSDYNADKSILTLTYNEEVNLTITNGILSSKFTSVTDDIMPASNINYTKVTHTDGNTIIKIQLPGMSLIGTYTITLDQGFVTDNFKNQSAIRTIVISNSSGNMAELPGPYAITQSSTNSSQITLNFLNKLDKVAAETVGNYSISGLPIIKAELTVNTTTGSTVVLTVADGSIEQEVARKINITGLMGYNNSYTAITAYSSTIVLKDNKKPYYIDPPIFDATAKNIRLNFSEAIKGTITFKVTQYIGSTPVEIYNTVTVNGSTATISLTSTPIVNSMIRIEVLTNAITDLSGNSVSPMPTQLQVYAIY